MSSVTATLSGMASLWVFRGVFTWSPFLCRRSCAMNAECRPKVGEQNTPPAGPKVHWQQT